MAKNKNEAAAPAPVKADPRSAKEARTKARKEANRKANEERAARNRLLRAQGRPTPHEEKRAARAEARKPKQQEYKRVQRARAEAREKRAAAEDAAREKLATDLLREHKSSSTKSRVRAIRSREDASI
jgi:hypothetical protein